MNCSYWYCVGKAVLFFRAREQNLEQLALLKTDHQREIEHLVAGHALEHSSSKVAELTNQVKSQEVWFYFILLI